MTLGEMLHRQAVRDAAATALFCRDEKISYGELDESSSRLACWLLEQGLQRGDRVAIHWSRCGWVRHWVKRNCVNMREPGLPTTVPERILFTPELPKGATGKVHRLSLKSMLARVAHEL